MRIRRQRFGQKEVNLDEFFDELDLGPRKARKRLLTFVEQPKMGMSTDRVEYVPTLGLKHSINLHSKSKEWPELENGNVICHSPEGIGSRRTLFTTQISPRLMIEKWGE
jgi:hypothetical protein